MKSGGRIPKRSSERRRRNLDSKPETIAAFGEVKPPPIPKGTHAIARKWYNSLKESGQSQYYEPSDWAAALFIASSMSQMLESDKFYGQAFSSIWSAMQDLLTTESARRRARIEVQRAAQDAVEDEQVTAIDRYRERMGV